MVTASIFATITQSQLLEDVKRSSLAHAALEIHRERRPQTSTSRQPQQEKILFPLANCESEFNSQSAIYKLSPLNSTLQNELVLPKNIKPSLHSARNVVPTAKSAHQKRESPRYGTTKMEESREHSREGTWRSLQVHMSLDMPSLRLSQDSKQTFFHLSMHIQSRQELMSLNAEPIPFASKPGVPSPLSLKHSSQTTAEQSTPNSAHAQTLPKSASKKHVLQCLHVSIMPLPACLRCLRTRSSW